MTETSPWETIGIFALIIILLALIPVALGLLGIIVLYILDASLWGYTPTTRHAFTALFILTAFDGVGSAAD